MSYLKQRYKEEFQRFLQPYEFKRYRNNFYRVVNDVFQSIGLHVSKSNCDCTIEFVVAPLCRGRTIAKSFCGKDHLKLFESDYSWFPYDKNNKESTDECVCTMLKYLKEYLIPYFESAKDAQSAYYKVCDFQRRNYKNGLVLHDYSLFWFSLKAGLYDKSLEHLKASKAQIEFAYSKNKEAFGDRLPMRYKKDIANELKVLDRQMEMVKKYDITQINEFIVQNERLALLNLRRWKPTASCILKKERGENSIDLH